MIGGAEGMMRKCVAYALILAVAATTTMSSGASAQGLDREASHAALRFFAEEFVIRAPDFREARPALMAAGYSVNDRVFTDPSGSINLSFLADGVFMKYELESWNGELLVFQAAIASVIGSAPQLVRKEPMLIEWKGEINNRTLTFLMMPTEMDDVRQLGVFAIVVGGDGGG